MRLRGDVRGEELAELLGVRVPHNSAYREPPQPHHDTKREHHITVPLHSPLKSRNVSGILADVADHMQISKETLVRELFHKR
ncbi:Uncharacterized [Moorella glycerini]|uniref:Uncharacterized protein n=1 Tax=Neomoorella stamsii TaxID=1266720 RepID=A0A9X7P5U9_9FIRM|nr:MULTISPECIES: hypothetical protein [Moorella]PRR71848.1 hypothetical protein MOST_21740 [Moorella stamsii]CEP66066.1 Uncharacterized [Moorella glycerini]